MLHLSWGLKQSYWGEGRGPGEGESRCLYAYVDLNAHQMVFSQHLCVSMCIHMHLFIPRSQCLGITVSPCQQCLKTKTIPTGLQINNCGSGKLMATTLDLKVYHLCCESKLGLQIKLCHHRQCPWSFHVENGFILQSWECAQYLRNFQIPGSQTIF